jgi:hypothetical protein
LDFIPAIISENIEETHEAVKVIQVVVPVQAPSRNAVSGLLASA